MLRVSHPRLMRFFFSLHSPIPEWDLQRICNGLATELKRSCFESEELRVKSEKSEFVPLAMGRAPKGILRIFSARLPLVAFDWKT